MGVVPCLASGYILLWKLVGFLFDLPQVFLTPTLHHGEGVLFTLTLWALMLCSYSYQCKPQIQQPTYKWQKYDTTICHPLIISSQHSYNYNGV